MRLLALQGVLVGLAAACSSVHKAPPVVTEVATPPTVVSVDVVNVAEPTSAPSSVESAIPRHADVAKQADPNEHIDSDGLRTTDLRVGNGPMVVSGATVLVHYEGRLESGEVFDSSLTRGSPFETTIGKGQVIQGWERGLLGMRVGGRRRLVIPPALGYGARGAPPKIQPNATLIFDVELLGLR